MTKEEILAISREENQDGDERDLQVACQAGKISQSFGIFLCTLIIFINQISRGPYTVSYAVLSIYFGIRAIEFWVKAAKLKKATRFLLAATFTILFLIIFWFYLQFTIGAQ